MTANKQRLEEERREANVAESKTGDFQSPFLSTPSFVPKEHLDKVRDFIESRRESQISISVEQPPADSFPRTDDALEYRRLLRWLYQQSANPRLEQHLATTDAGRRVKELSGGEF